MSNIKNKLSIILNANIFVLRSKYIEKTIIKFSGTPVICSGFSFLRDSFYEAYYGRKTYMKIICPSILKSNLNQTPYVRYRVFKCPLAKRSRIIYFSYLNQYALQKILVDSTEKIPVNFNGNNRKF